MSVRRMASVGRSRISPNPETRTPLMSTTGRPPPRPRLLPSCGPSAVSNSATELTPSARISSDDSWVSGAMSPITMPGSRLPVTTTSSRASSAVAFWLAARAGCAGAGSDPSSEAPLASMATPIDERRRLSESDERGVVIMHPCILRVAHSTRSPGWSSSQVLFLRRSSAQSPTTRAIVSSAGHHRLGRITLRNAFMAT